MTSGTTYLFCLVQFVRSTVVGADTKLPETFVLLKRWRLEDAPEAGPDWSARKQWESNEPRAIIKIQAPGENASTKKSVLFCAFTTSTTLRPARWQFNVVALSTLLLRQIITAELNINMDDPVPWIKAPKGTR